MAQSLCIFFFYLLLLILMLSVARLIHISKVGWLLDWGLVKLQPWPLSIWVTKFVQVFSNTYWVYLREFSFSLFFLSCFSYEFSHLSFNQTHTWNDFLYIMYIFRNSILCVDLFFFR